jgi:hypothetical protein
MSKGKPEKVEEALLRARVSLAATDGSLRISLHARQRQGERSVTDLQIVHLLKRPACRAPARDRFDDQRQAWTYGYEGADLDGRRLRVIVALAEGVLVVTAVVLEDAP